MVIYDNDINGPLRHYNACMADSNYTEEHNDSVVEYWTRGRRVATGNSLETLRCVLEQDTPSSAKYCMLNPGKE